MIDLHSLKVLEFEAVKEMLVSQATSTPGRELCERLMPFNDLVQIEQTLEETEEIRLLMISQGEPPLAGLRDIRLHLDRSMLEGAVLQASELKEVEGVLHIAGRLKSYFHSRAARFPRLNGYFSSILPQPQLQERIAHSIGEENEILDGASPRLKKIRRDSIDLREKIRGRMQEILLIPAYQKVIAEPLVTIRNDRYVIPVRPNFKTALRGFIQDQSASGQTFFLEPLSLVDENNRLKRLSLEEEEEVRAILENLTHDLRKRALEIRPGVEAMIRLDLLSAKGKLAERMDARKPMIKRDGGLQLLQARHPLLIKKMESPEGRAREKGQAIPIDISLGGALRTLVITGPNMGGKTVALKTTGILPLMAMAGLHIPASSDSEIPLFSRIFANIGEEQNIEQSLSTFSSHIVQITKILREADERSLVLLDELGSGTDPEEGSALGIAILEELYQRKTLTLATTHQDAIKAYAYSHPGMENASVEFDLDTLQPLYKLNIGIPGRSYALDIAQQLGIGSEVIRTARGLLKSELVSWDSLLRHIQEDRASIELSRRRAEEEAARACQLKEEYESILHELREQKRTIEQEGHDKIAELISHARRKIEGIIREIRTQSASRESIKEGQQVLKTLTREANQLRSETSEGAARDEGAQFMRGMALEKGQRVRVKTLRQEGMVLGKADESGIVEVQIKMGKLRLPQEELELTARASVPLSSPIFFHRAPEGEGSQIRAELNLIGKRREEAIATAEKYLDEVGLAGLKEVRIIHGKGTGILRKGIEEMLRAHPWVEGFHLASFNEGGTGATVVRLKA